MRENKKGDQVIQQLTLSNLITAFKKYGNGVIIKYLLVDVKFLVAMIFSNSAYGFGTEFSNVRIQFVDVFTSLNQQ